jgi:hypothetical protein
LLSTSVGVVSTGDNAAPTEFIIVVLVGKGELFTPDVVDSTGLNRDVTGLNRLFTGLVWLEVVPIAVV